ncbi:immunoglobulin V-set domain protein, partial [Ostertagia ostertagi]
MKKGNKEDFIDVMKKGNKEDFIIDGSTYYVHVKQGQVARLPCAGLPDVVPGPAEICFIKSGSDSDECLSDKVDSNYLSTSTGMQISVVQPHHAGEYYCVVRNEYTKQTRRSPRYVKLRVRSDFILLHKVTGTPLIAGGSNRK